MKNRAYLEKRARDKLFQRANEEYAQPSQNAKGTQKRNRTHGETPPDVQRKTKMAKNSSQSGTPATHTSEKWMSAAVKDAHLLVAVIDMPIDGIIVPLSKEKYNLIYRTINTFLAEEIKKAIQIRTFEENMFVRGVMRIRCSTQGAKNWLASAIQYIPQMWENMKLVLVEYDKIPIPYKILGLFPNCSMNSNDICKLLQAANPFVRMECWTILNQSESNAGTHICFALSEDQYQTVKDQNFGLYFGAGIARFKDLTENKSMPKAQNVILVDSELETEQSETEENDITVVNKEQSPNIEQLHNTDLMEVEHNVDVLAQPMAGANSSTESIKAQFVDDTGADITANKNAQQIKAGAEKMAEMNLNVEK